MSSTREDEIWPRNNCDFEHGVVEEEEEEETVYESDGEVKASGLSKGLRPWLGNQGLRPFPNAKANPDN